MEGSLTDDTIVWTEGMDDWMPLRKCRSVFNFGEDSESEEEVDYMEMINEFDEDDMDGMPVAVLSLPSTKRREPEAATRRTVIEVLLLLSWRAREVRGAAVAAGNCYPAMPSRCCC